MTVQETPPFSPLDVIAQKFRYEMLASGGVGRVIANEEDAKLPLDTHNVFDLRCGLRIIVTRHPEGVLVASFSVWPDTEFAKIERCTVIKAAFVALSVITGDNWQIAGQTSCGHPMFVRVKGGEK